MSALVTFYWSPRSLGDIRLRVGAFSRDEIAVVTDLVVSRAPAPLVTIQGSRSMRSVRMRAYRRERTESGANVMVRGSSSTAIGAHLMVTFSATDLRGRGSLCATPDEIDEQRRVRLELWPAIESLLRPRGSVELVHNTPVLIDGYTYDAWHPEVTQRLGR